MGRPKAATERELRGRAVDPVDVRVRHQRNLAAAGNERREQLDGANREVNAGGSEDDVVLVARHSIGDLSVERASPSVPLAEFAFVARERPPASLHTPPRGVGVDVEVNDERFGRIEKLPRLDGAAADGDDGVPATAERVPDEPSLDLAERDLPLARKHVPDRAVRALDLTVDVAKRPREPPRHLLSERRLPRAHEADEDEVPV